METKLVNRYLMGLICNKGTSNGCLPRNIVFPDDRHNLIAKVLLELLNNKSSMANDVIIKSIEMAVLEVAGIEEWDENKEWFEAYVYTAEGCEVSAREVEELYDILQRQRISNHAKALIARLLESEEFSEEDLDNALTKLRLLKAVYPSKTAMLDEQTATAVYDAINSGEGLIPYGFKPIDDAMAGVFRKEITTIAGRPGHGKTTLVCQFVLNWLALGYKVLFISKEMSAERVMHKFMSNLGNISSDEIKTGTVEDTDYLKSVADAFVRKYKDLLFLYDDVYKTNEMEGLILKHQPDIVVDDFIQFTDFEGEKAVTAIPTTYKHYKRLSKENNCAFVVLSQLNRDIEKREDPRPRLSDLAESGAIETLSAYVCFIFYEYKFTYDKAKKNSVEFIAAKTRYGESEVVPLGYEGDKQRYYALPANKGR